MKTESGSQVKLCQKSLMEAELDSKEESQKGMNREKAKAKAEARAKVEMDEHKWKKCLGVEEEETIVETTVKTSDMPNGEDNSGTEAETKKEIQAKSKAKMEKEGLVEIELEVGCWTADVEEEVETVLRREEEETGEQDFDSLMYWCR